MGVLPGMLLKETEFPQSLSTGFSSSCNLFTSLYTFPVAGIVQRAKQQLHVDGECTVYNTEQNAVDHLKHRKANKVRVCKGI